MKVMPFQLSKKPNLKMAIVCLLLVDQNVSSSAMLPCQLSCSLCHDNQSPSQTVSPQEILSSIKKKNLHI